MTYRLAARPSHCPRRGDGAGPGSHEAGQKEDVMALELGFPVFDGDNHLQETRGGTLRGLMKVGT